MSRHHIEKVTCPSCHHEGDFELWDSINTALDPERACEKISVN